MAKKKMICPFSGKLCRECSMFRGRHYFLCFDRKYRGSIDIDRTKVELPKELPQLVAGQRMPRVEDLKSLSIKGGNETKFIVDDDKVMRDYCETNLNTFGKYIYILEINNKVEQKLKFIINIGSSNPEKLRHLNFLRNMLLNSAVRC